MSPELCYAVGMLLALMMGGALTVSLAKERGWRKVLPIAIVATLCAGLAIGWALTGEFTLVSLGSRPGD